MISLKVIHFAQRNYATNYTRGLIVALLIPFCLLLLTGCTFHSQNRDSVRYTSPSIFSGSFHYTVQQGINSTINVKAKPGLNNWDRDTQFSLIPAGPYVSHKQPLDFRPLAIASNGNLAYVATSSKKNNHSYLQTIRFSGDGHSIKIGNKIFINGVVTKLVYDNNRLILALKQGGINVVDVSNPASPITILNYPTKSPVLDIQYDNQSTYLLLANNLLLKINLTSKHSDVPLGKLLGKWSLPVSAISIAIRNKQVWLAGPQGIASVKLTDTSAKLVGLYKTSGTPLSIHLSGDLALISDGPGGLVIFKIKLDGQAEWLGSYNKRGAITALTTTFSKKESNNNVIATLSNGSVMSIGITNPELPGSGVVFKPQHSLLATTLSITSRSSSAAPVALLATENALLRVVMTGDNRQLISAEGVNQGGSRRGVIRDNILYVADWFSGIHLYDISNPKQISHLSNYHTPGSSKGVTLMGNYALIGDDDQGLQIIDIQDPAQPRWVSELLPEALAGVGLAYTMKLVKNTLYLADHRGGFHIIDLSDIKQPKRLGGYNTPGKSWGLDVVNKFVLVADDASGLLIFDASDANKPELVGQFNPGGQAEDILIKNNLAYVTFFDKGLYILDVHRPQNPKVIGHVFIPGNARGISLTDNLAYIAGWESGLHVIDISKPKTPHIIGSYDTDGAAWGVNIKDGVAYVLDWWGGIKMIDVRQPSNPVYLSQYHASYPLQQMRSRNKYLYAAAGFGGLQVYDISNPLNPIWTTGINFNGKAEDVWLDEDRAYVAVGKNGIVIVDILDPFYTRRIGRVSTPGIALRVRAWNELLYIQDSRAGLIVVDIRDPHRPQEIGRYQIQINDLWVDGNAFWLGTAQGLIWWNHGDSGTLANKLTSNLSDKNWLTIPGGIDWVRSQNDLVVTAQSKGLISLWRKTSQGLKAISRHQIDEPITDLQLEQDTIYALGKRSGLMAINISDPKSPRLTASYPPTGKHTRFTIAQGAAFFAGESHLPSVTLLPSISTAHVPMTDTINKLDNIKIHLPAELPIGQYHILATTPTGQQELMPNALRVQFSAVNRGKYPLEAMRQMLKSPAKQPAEP